PASMGQAPALALGLALARPELGVVVVCGDGHLLMNLGCLVTLASYAADVFLVVIDNGVYEVTGGQAVPGAGRTDFAGLARAAGEVILQLSPRGAVLEITAPQGDPSRPARTANGRRLGRRRGASARLRDPATGEATA